RRARVASIPLVVAIGALLILSAHDVRSWRDLLRADAVQHSGVPAKALKLRASTDLPSSVSGGLLGVGVDRDWLKALQKFWVAYKFTKNVESLDRNSYVLLNQGEAALRGLTQDRDRARASQAFDLLA